MVYGIGIMCLSHGQGKQETQYIQDKRGEETMAITLDDLIPSTLGDLIPSIYLAIGMIIGFAV